MNFNSKCEPVLYSVCLIFDSLIDFLFYSHNYFSEKISRTAKNLLLSADDLDSTELFGC